jgi:hypothetical protein
MLISHLTLCMISGSFWNHFQFWILFSLERRKMSLGALSPANEENIEWWNVVLDLGFPYGKHRMSQCIITVQHPQIWLPFFRLFISIYTFIHFRIQEWSSWFTGLSFIFVTNTSYSFLGLRWRLMMGEGSYLVEILLFLNQKNHSDIVVWL